MAETRDIRGERGYNPNQHCTYENQDGEDDYSFSHTAEYCGRPQPRRCPCPFDYPVKLVDDSAPLKDRLRAYAEEDEVESTIADLLREAAEAIEAKDTTLKNIKQLVWKLDNTMMTGFTFFNLLNEELGK